MRHGADPHPASHRRSTCDLRAQLDHHDRALLTVLLSPLTSPGARTEHLDSSGIPTGPWWHVLGTHDFERCFDPRDGVIQQPASSPGFDAHTKQR